LLLLAVVPLLALSWWLFRSFENAYLDMVGTNLSHAADTAFGSVNNYLQDQIIEVAGLTEVPALREAVKQGNLDLQRDLEAVRRAIPRMETEWPKLQGGDPRLDRILNNAGSRFLQRYISVNRAYREIMVTDFLGRLVAASGKTTDYYQADEEWWKETYGDGFRGSVFIGDVNFDESSKTYAMELAQPLVEADLGVIGVIKVVLDGQRIHAIVGSFRPGPSTIAVLMRAKGEVISAPGYNLMDQRTYPATLEILNARDKGRRYFISDADPAAVYGLAQISFQQLYPRLNWILVTTGEVGQVLGPLPQMRRYFIYLVVAVVLAGLIAALLISMVQSRPTIEQDVHLERL
ncbi:MAG: hypothetical protein FJW35_08280, partial [Acidobacteria bacterium]|nr:hypothetical protein [Acidobacteriota bacterium]